MNSKKQKKFIRIMAWILSILMVGSTATLVISLLINMIH